MAFSNSITTNLSIIILFLILLSSSSIHAIDCGGKPFHCENATHFKICVDFGNGVSSTVDDFVIPCPPGTECRGKNHFECEFLPATTPAAIALSDVTNDTKVLDSATTLLMWEVVTTNLPPGSQHDKEFSERYLNTEIPLNGSHLPKLSTDSGQLPNNAEVIVTTNFPETLTGTTVDMVTFISQNITDKIINVTSMVPESLYPLAVNEQNIVATESPVAVIPLNGAAVNKTAHDFQVTDVSMSEATTAMLEELNKSMIIETTSVSTTDKTASVAEGSEIIQIKENKKDTYLLEKITSTPNLENLTVFAVDNPEEYITHITVINSPSIGARFNKTVNNQAIFKNISESNDVIVVTTVAPAQFNSSSIDNIPEELAATEIAEAISNQGIPEIVTYESLIDTTEAQPTLGNSFGVDTGFQIVTSVPYMAQPLQNDYVTTSTPVILNASKVYNFEAEFIPTEPPIVTVFEVELPKTVINQETTENVVNVAGIFETTTPGQVITNALSEFQNELHTDAQPVNSFQTIDNGQDLITNDLFVNFTPEVSTAEELITTTLSEAVRDTVPVEPHLSGVFGNILITTENTATMNKNHINKGNEINFDTTTQTQIPVNDMTTELPDVVTHRAAVPVVAHSSDVFYNILTTTERMTTAIKNTIKKGNVIIANIEGIFETTKPAQVITNALSEFQNEQQTEAPLVKRFQTIDNGQDLITNDLIGTFTTTGEIEKTSSATISDAVPVEAHLGGVFDSILISTESTATMNKNGNNKGNGINLDTTKQTDLNTEFIDFVTHSDAVPVQAHLDDTFDTILITTESTTAITKNPNDFTTETQIPVSDVPTELQDIVTQTQSILRDTTADESILTPDSSSITEFPDSIATAPTMNTVANIELITLSEPNYDIVPLIKTSTTPKTQEVTVTATDFSQTIFEGAGFESEGINENEGWLILKNVETTTDNIIIKEAKKSIMTKTNVISKSDISTELPLPDENNKVTPGLFENVLYIDNEANNHKIMPSNKRFTIKNIQEKEGAAATEKLDSTTWDPSDGLLMNMPNVVFELDKNTDSILSVFVTGADTDTGMDETSYVGQQYKKTTGYNEAFPILSETIPDPVINQVPSSENVIEISQNIVKKSKSAIYLLANGTIESITKVPSQIANIEKNTNTISFEYITESATVPLKGTNEDLKHINNAYLVTNPHINGLVSKTDETEQRTPAETSGVLSNVESSYIGHSDRGKYVSLDPVRDSSSVPETESQNAQNRNVVLTTYFQTTASDASAIPIKQTTVMSNIMDLKTGNTEHLENTVTSTTPSSQTYNTQKTVKWGLTDHITNAGIDKEELTNNNGKKQIRTMSMAIESTTPISSTYTSLVSYNIETGGSNIHRDARDSVLPIIKNKTDNFKETSVKDITVKTSYNASTLESSSNEKKKVVTDLPSKTYLMETRMDTNTPNSDKTSIYDVTTIITERLTPPTQIIEDTPVEKEEVFTKSPSKEMRKTLLAGTTILPNVQTTITSKNFTQSITNTDNITTHGSDINDDSNVNGEVSKLFLASASIPPSLESSYANTQVIKNPTSASSTETTIIDKSVITASTITTTTKADENITMSGSVTPMADLGYDCSTVVRGRFSDKFDCRKFYICIDKHAIVGYCPGNAVFSPIKKQCTKNLAHCLRNGEFQCTSQGRFVDIQRKNIYYICVQNAPAFVRFQFQCQDGFILNKSTIRCEKFVEIPVTPGWLNLRVKKTVQSRDVSKKALEKKVAKQKTNESDVSNKDSEQSTSDASKKDKNPKSNESTEPKDEIDQKRKSIKCTSVGKIPHPEDCRKYYVCYKNKKSELRRKRKKCDSDEVFDKNKNKCVDSESYECNLG